MKIRIVIEVETRMERKTFNAVVWKVASTAFGKALEYVATEAIDSQVVTHTGEYPTEAVGII